MTAAGLLPLVKTLLVDPETTWPYDLAFFGFFGGAALLPALSFRQAQRHYASGVSWNIHAHHKIWFDKMAAVACAIISAGLIVCSVQIACSTIALREIRPGAVLEAVVLLIIIVSSAGLWTLVARSISVGIILTAVCQAVLYLLLVAFVRAIDAMAPGNPYATRISHEPDVHAALLPFIGACGLSYAALMLWLSRKKFVAMLRH
jgi:hypothetical protein